MCEYLILVVLFVYNRIDKRCWYDKRKERSRCWLRCRLSIPDCCCASCKTRTRVRTYIHTDWTLSSYFKCFNDHIFQFYFIIFLIHIYFSIWFFFLIIYANFWFLVFIFHVCFICFFSGEKCYGLWHRPSYT